MITITEQSEISAFAYDVNGDTLTFSITEFDEDFGETVTITIEFRRV
jgi:hypothetical protein